MGFVGTIVYDGSLKIDASPQKEVIAYLQPGALVLLKRTKDEDLLAGVRGELKTALPLHGAKLGFGADVLQRIDEYSTNIENLKPIRDEATKLAKAAADSIAFYEDAREAEIGAVADAVKRRRRKNPAVAAPFEKTLEYSALYANKAAATRRKNKKAEAAGEVVVKGKAKGKAKAAPRVEEVESEEKPG
jgi:hypothetical protein